MARMGEKGHCFNCGAELKPVFPEHVARDEVEKLDFVQYDNALPISFDGGYGMFHDDIEHGCRFEVVICHDCAHELCKLVPWIGKLISPESSHSHTEEYVKAHPDHFGWDFETWDGHLGWKGKQQVVREAHGCPKCGHPWSARQHTNAWFDGKPGTYCMANMGMGDPCGCAREPAEWVDDA